MKRLATHSKLDACMALSGNSSSAYQQFSSTRPRPKQNYESQAQISYQLEPLSSRNYPEKAVSLSTWMIPWDRTVQMPNCVRRKCIPWLAKTNYLSSRGTGCKLPLCSLIWDSQGESPQDCNQSICFMSHGKA